MRYVLDTAVFIHGVDVEGVTVPSVVEEVEGERARLFLETHYPEVRVPEEEFVERARSAAGRTGDLPVLSETDLSLLGLALQESRSGEEVEVVTDDYAVQNVASRLGVRFRSLEHRGIGEELVWEWFCPACGRVYDDQRERCGVCGTELKRRAT